MRFGKAASIALLAAGGALLPGVAFAHGAPQPEPTPGHLLLAWQPDIFFLIPAGIVVWAYMSAVRNVNRAHPANPVPRIRSVYFLGGMAVLAIALVSPIGAYDTDLFAVHMAQHMLIIMVAVPLMLLGAPITLILRVSSPRVRKEIVLPVLHSRIVRWISFPAFTWVLLAGILWATHYSSAFNFALENVWAHRAEHMGYIICAALFWWPAVAVDPSPWRLNHPVRLLYVFLQMPQNSFLGVSIYSAETVIFPHYASVARTWGPSALTDQEFAGVVMWVIGDMMFLTTLAFIAYGWVKHEEKEGERADRARAREKAAAANALLRQETLSRVAEDLGPPPTAVPES
jgi:cytochrome c oxidase assembly factor CtaG